MMPSIKRKAALAVGGLSAAAALLAMSTAPASAALSYGKLKNVSSLQ